MWQITFPRLIAREGVSLPNKRPRGNLWGDFPWTMGERGAAGWSEASRGQREGCRKAWSRDEVMGERRVRRWEAEERCSGKK